MEEFGVENVDDGKKQDEAVEDELMCKPCDTRVPKSLFDPLLPSKADVDSHNLTHNPYRSWCSVCVKARGKEDPHKRNKDVMVPGETMPLVGLDYDYFGDAEDDIAKVTAMVCKDKLTGMLWGNVSSVKGPGDAWMVNKVVKNIELLGRANTKLKTDGEPALVAFQSRVIAARN